MRNAPRVLATPAIHEMATSEGLGKIQATLDTSKSIRSKRTLGIFGLIVGVVVALIGLGMVLSGGEAGLYIIIGIPVCVVGANFIYQSWKSLSASLPLARDTEKMLIHVCDNGLIVVQKNAQPQPFRWETLRVWRAVTEYRIRLRGFGMSGTPLPTETAYTFTLQRDDGYKVVIHSRNDLVFLDLYLRVNIPRAHLPGYRAAYKAGQTLDFGQLTLSQQGIDNGREVLPWASVHAIDAKDGYITVQSSAGDRLSWRNIPAESIPNVFAFLALTDSILGKEGRR